MGFKLLFVFYSIFTICITYYCETKEMYWGTIGVILPYLVIVISMIEYRLRPKKNSLGVSMPTVLQCQSLSSADHYTVLEIIKRKGRKRWFLFGDYIYYMNKRTRLIRTHTKRLHNDTHDIKVELLSDNRWYNISHRKELWAEDIKKLIDQYKWEQQEEKKVIDYALEKIYNEAKLEQDPPRGRFDNIEL